MLLSEVESMPCPAKILGATIRIVERFGRRRVTALLCPANFLGVAFTIVSADGLACICC
jgi:hypothetical protein